MKTNRNYNSFVNGYIGAMLWSTNDESDEGGGEPLDKNYDKGDIASSSMKSIRKDCALFIRKNRKDLERFVDEVVRGREDGGPWSLAGYCFWLDRNGHGTGFWDRDVGAVGDRLSAACKRAGHSDAYVGDNGEIYVSPER